MACHPEARQEGNGELEDESGDVGREGDEAQVEYLGLEHKMVENVVEQPFQSQVQATATAVAEQLQAQEASEWRIKEIDDRCQQSLDTFFYIANHCCHSHINS